MTQRREFQARAQQLQVGARELSLEVVALTSLVGCGALEREQLQPEALLLSGGALVTLRLDGLGAKTRLLPVGNCPPAFGLGGIGGVGLPAERRLQLSDVLLLDVEPTPKPGHRLVEAGHVLLELRDPGVLDLEVLCVADLEITHHGREALDGKLGERLGRERGRLGRLSFPQGAQRHQIGGVTRGAIDSPVVRGPDARSRQHAILRNVLCRFLLALSEASGIKEVDEVRDQPLGSRRVVQRHDLGAEACQR